MRRTLIRLLLPVFLIAAPFHGFAADQRIAAIVNDDVVSVRDLNERLPNQGHFFNVDHATARFTPAGPDHAQVAAVNGVIDYLELVHDHQGGDPAAPLGEKARWIHDAFQQQERTLLQPLLDFLSGHPGVHLIGRDSSANRAPTVAFTVPGKSSAAVGKSLGENIAGHEVYDDDVIRSLDNPIWTAGGLAVVKGNLAPRGAVIKPAAAESHLLQHQGPAIVFKNYNDMASRIDDPNLEVTADSVLVLQNAGPVGAPGMPEWGQLPIPRKLLEQGVRAFSTWREHGTGLGLLMVQRFARGLGGELELANHKPHGACITLKLPCQSESL